MPQGVAVWWWIRRAALTRGSIAAWPERKTNRTTRWGFCLKFVVSCFKKIIMLFFKKRSVNSLNRSCKCLNALIYLLSYLHWLGLIDWIVLWGKMGGDEFSAAAAASQGFERRGQCVSSWDIQKFTGARAHTAPSYSDISMGILA